MHIEPGVHAREQRIVTDSDTAHALGTGEVPVLATSRLIAWCEVASFRTLAPHVPEGSTSVAMRVQIDHIRPAAVGSTVTATATLERVEGRRYVFEVSATGVGDEELASGRIVRVLVDIDPFLAKAAGSLE